MMTWTRKEQEEYERAAIEEVEAELRRNDPLRDITYRSFVSTSNGRGRNPRRPRQIELLIIGETTYTMGEDFVVRRRDGRGLGGDRLAQEVGFETSDQFINAIRRRGK
jgi:hypothetical protein